jgi:very-short-patch-repair endonuclease
VISLRVGAVEGRPVAEAIDRRISLVAKKQHGYITRVQLLELGLSPSGIAHRVHAGRLIRIYKGVYAVGHKPTLPLDRTHSVLLACGSGSALAGVTAGSVWGLWKEWRMPFHVIAPRMHRHPGITVHRSTALTRGDIRVQLGLRVTSPARTALDVAPGLTEKQLKRAVNTLRLATYLRLPGDINDVIERFPRHPGARRLAWFVANPGRPTRSEFEDAFPEFARRHGLPEVQINVMIAGYEIDVVYMRERVIVELDGHDVHSGRVAFEYDREKDADMAAEGFVTVRMTWERMVERPEREAARLLRILERRRAEGAKRAA